MFVLLNLKQKYEKERNPHHKHPRKINSDDFRDFSIPSSAAEVYVKIEHRLAHLPLTEAEVLPCGEKA